MSVDLHANNPCDCDPGQCRAFVEPDTKCINRLIGEVRTMLCPKCAPGATWHHNGICLKCKAQEPK